MPRAMKDSGIKWIGFIPADWTVGKVSYFFDIQLGKMLQPEANDETDTLEDYLCAANLGGNKLKLDTLRKMWFSLSDKTKFDVRKGDLLVVEGGDVASCDVVNEDIHDVYIQNALHRVRSNSGFDVRLLRYLLIVAKAQGHIDLICNKATIAHFTKEKFSSIPYLIMPLDEQQRIATFLDGKCARIDSVIEKTRASIVEYKKLKQAIITRAVTKGMKPARPMKDSGVEWLGDIPADWSMCRLRFLCDILTGNQDTQDNDPNGEYPFYVRSPIVERSNKYTFEGDAILMAGDGVGAGKVFHYVSGKYGCHQRVYSLQNIRGIARRFLYYYLQNRFYVSIETANSKSTVDSVRLIMLKNFPILIPPLEEQKEIAAYLDKKTAAIDSLIEKKGRLVTELERLKKSLIFEYVTGKKEAPERT